jgi:predicted PurR-regulated permease PerM
MSDQQREGWFSREHTLVLVLAGATCLAFYVCYRLAVPFLPALTWAAALAVVAHPMHAWLERKFSRPGLAAGVAVTIVAVAVIGPTIFACTQIVRQLTENADQLQAYIDEAAAQHPSLEPIAEVLQQEQLSEDAQQIVKSVAASVPSYVNGSLWAGAQLLFTAFVLFFFFRDRQLVLDRLKSLSPLTNAETNHTLQRIEDTIFATLYGKLVVAVIQGALGGLIFWMLGLPAPLLWGVIMTLLAIVPTLGTFVIWAPAAILMAANGEWGKAVILVVWGSVVIGLIDNFLYPILVGPRLRLHPLLVFIALVGGIATFGMAGVVLGPVALSVTDALIEVWRRRTAEGKNAEDATAPESVPAKSIRRPKEATAAAQPSAGRRR